MRIGELAKKAGTPVATIRYYEQEGIMAKPARSDSNYRHYGAEAITRLGFILRCRSLGIGLAEIRRLLNLASVPDANCVEVDVLLDAHISRVREQRRNLARLERELTLLRADCHPAKQVRGCGILRDSSLVATFGGHKFESKKSELSQAGYVPAVERNFLPDLNFLVFKPTTR